MHKMEAQDGSRMIYQYALIRVTLLYERFANQIKLVIILGRSVHNE